MRIRVIHLWTPSVISWVLAVLLSFSSKPLESVFFSVLYLTLLVCTKWADA